MYLTRLALTDFRSYAAADLSLGPGVTILTGANGEGKTNLVEAAAYVAALASHRVPADAPLVRRGAQRAIVRAAVTSAARDSLVEIEINPGKANRARLNRVPVPRARQVLGTLRTVMFAPEDLALVKGDPEQRRRYLDELLVARAPRYAAVRADYDRVLRQRAALLKSLRLRPGQRVPVRAVPGRAAGPAGEEDTPPARGAAATLEVWDEKLATAGAELVAARLELVAALRPLVADAYAQVSGGGGEATLAYRPSRWQAPPTVPPAHLNGAAAAPGAGPGGPGVPAVPGGPAAPGSRVPPGPAIAAGTAVPAGPAPSEPGDGHGGGEAAEPPADRAAVAASLGAAITAARAEELERGVCLVGPHRDELELRIGGLPARGYASQGESWSLALGLRLAAFQLLRAGGDDPVLILDDVFAELDAGRRERLASLVAGAEQVLVTAAVAADVPTVLTGARFEVAGGTVTRAG